MTQFITLAAAGAESDKGMLETFGVNAPLFISQLIAFTIVALLLKKFAYKPVLDMLEQRKARIAEAEANAENKSVQTPNENIKPQSLVLRNSFSYRKTTLRRKRWAAVLPQRELQSAALRGRRVEWGYEVFLSFRILLPDSSSQRFLSSPS